ncbi:TPA: DUF551 domain-containing protein [Klebsiella pneumoniae]|nr:DUF551 domain-containing protein [Klebsiella pneumoniae]HBZ1403088.1 DUF551 domain-containing protein [Klebsiella pneumoniae]
MSITRERLLEIIVTGPEASGAEQNELARMALAAMDSSESVELPLDYLQGHKDGLEWAAQLAEANHPETGDWLYDDPIELAKAIRKGPDMPPAQPVADSEPVAWLLSGGGAKNVVCFDSGNAYADPLREVTPLYRHAQPAPVVPQDVLDALQKVARIRLDMNDFDGDRRGIADCLGDAEEALIEVVNRRAAMLHAGTLTNEGTIQAVNSPVIPGWIPVSERMPEREVDVQVYCPDKKEQMVAYLERNELEGYFRFATWRTGEGIYCQPTHWMPLPAGPKEDINALIPLVSRNEQEVK